MISRVGEIHIFHMVDILLPLLYHSIEGKAYQERTNCFSACKLESFPAKIALWSGTNKIHLSKMFSDHEIRCLIALFQYSPRDFVLSMEEEEDYM